MSAVDWILSKQDDVHVGDVVSADAGVMPTYRVVSIDPEGEALLEDEHHAAVRAPLDRFPWKAAGRA